MLLLSQGFVSGYLVVFLVPRVDELLVSRRAGVLCILDRPWFLVLDFEALGVGLQYALSPESCERLDPGLRDTRVES